MIITVFFSGSGTGTLAQDVKDTQNPARWKTIASHDGHRQLNGNLDEFNIGIVMPQIAIGNWEQAYWAEVARLNGQQSPLKWP